MGIDQTSSRITLVIRHAGPWDGSDAQLYLLQEKLNAYLSFALDGEMTETSPQFADRPLAILIETTTSPDPQTLHLLAHVRQQLQFQDVTLAVRISPSTEPAESTPSADPGPDCGSSCHCH